MAAKKVKPTKKATASKVGTAKKAAAKKAAAKKAGAKKKAAAAKWSSAPEMATITIHETTAKPLAVAVHAAPPTVVKTARIHPRRFPPRVPEGQERIFPAVPHLALAAAAAAQPGDELKVVLDTELIGPGAKQTASNVGEPSVAINGNVVFYTGNWYAAFSVDGGKTFMFIDPATAFAKFDPPGMSFCCDQVVQYIPAIDTFVWLLQYSTANDLDNMQRLAFARTADVAQRKFRLFDISAKALGVPGTFLDFPDLAVGANSLYVTTNVFPPNTMDVGSAVVRIPLASIATGPIKAQRFVTFENDSLRVAQNCGTTAFFAAHRDTSTLRLFSWEEAKATPTSVDVPVARWIGGQGYHSRTPDGRRWLDRADPRLTGATLADNQLWFAWGVNRGSNQRPRPFVQIARIDAKTSKLIENINVFDQDSATCYGALATNADGEVGIAYFIGGGLRFPTLAVGILSGARRDQEVAKSGRAPLAEKDGHHWGDYLAVRPAFPAGKLFAASGYVMKGGGDGDGSNRDCTPHFVVFGRQKNA